MSSDEDESLQILCARTNRSGRPKTNKTIKFTKQPKSQIISQFLKDAGEKIINENIDDQLGNSPLTQDNEIETIKATKSCEKDSKVFSCDYPECTYSSKLSCNLLKHKRKHTSEKPYICHKCTFRTNYINSLKVHQRLHSNERPYECKKCSYKCNSSSNLKKHCLHRHDVDPAKTN